MFGLVPRVVWSKLTSADERGRIQLTHNCLLLTRGDQPEKMVLIETGSGNKFDAKSRDIFGLKDYSIADALREKNIDPTAIENVIVSHLHFDHAGGLTTLQPGAEAPGSPALTFPNATIHVQQREWIDANANNSVMTRTYLRENLDPIRGRLKLIDSPPPFTIGHVPARDEMPASPVLDRLTEILPGIFGLLVPGHTWGQQAIVFSDDRDRTIVFTPDVMPTVHHIGAAYNMAYDVEPYLSSNTRRWFLQAAVEHDWTLAIDHEPGDPIRKVEMDGRGWYRFKKEIATAEAPRSAEPDAEKA